MATRTARRPERELLAAVPVVTDYVTRSDRPGGCTLRRRLPAPGRITRLLERFGLTKEHAFELDSVGADFFDAIDGTRDLCAIEMLLRARHGFGELDSRRAVIAFTEALMARGLIALDPSGRARISTKTPEQDNA
jgi:hypothetical protein